MAGSKPEPLPALGRVRRILWLVVVAVLVGGLGIALSYRYASGPDTRQSEPLPFGGPFTLTAPDGATVTERTLAGKPYAIFFGYTRCPDVCPTSLARMARLRKQLGADGMKFRIVFVSVDPGHDKPADLGSYVALFGTPILGLAGTDAQIDQIKQGYHVYAAKVPQQGGDYTIDHTASIFLMTARGELAGVIDHDEPDSSALAKLKHLVA